MRLIADADAGYDTRQIIAIRNIPWPAKVTYRSFKQELLTHAGIEGVSASTEEPSRDILDGGQVSAEGKLQKSNSPIFRVLLVAFPSKNPVLGYGTGIMHIRRQLLSGV